MAKKHFFYAFPLLTLLSLAPDALLASVEDSKESITAPAPKHKHPPIEGFKEIPKEASVDKAEDKIEDSKPDDKSEQKDSEVASSEAKDDSEYKEDDLERLIHSLDKDGKEEVATSEPAKDDKKDEVVSSDDAKDDKKDEKKEEVCAAGEQVKILSAQIESLMKEQNLILEAMLNLTKAMLNMSQNMQSQQPYFPTPQTAYQYQAPMAQGNWVYYPQGFQPGGQMSQGFYPDQAGQQSWGLAPSAQYQMPMQQMPMQQQMPMMMQQQQMPMMMQPQQQLSMAPQMNQLSSGLGYNMISDASAIGQFGL